MAQLYKLAAAGAIKPERTSRLIPVDKRMHNAHLEPDTDPRWLHKVMQVGGLSLLGHPPSSLVSALIALDLPSALLLFCGAWDPQSDATQFNGSLLYQRVDGLI